MHWRDALSTYATRHEDHCTEFACAVLERTERGDLLKEAGPTKPEFIDYLESGLVERDFRELFRSVAKLCDRLTDLSDVVTSLEVEFLSEVIDCLFEAHT